MAVQVTNTTASLSGKTLLKAEDAQTITGLKTFDRGSSAPFACVAGSAKVDYLDTDKLDGQEGSYYLDPANLSSAVPIAKGGTAGTATPTAGGVPYGTGTAFAFTAAGTAGQILKSNGSSAPAFANEAMTLLHADNGSTTSTSAENVDTIAISGLTALDTIRVIVTMEAVTQASGAVTLYSTTDSATLTDLTAGGTFSAGQVRQMEATLRMRQGSTTAGIGTAIGNYSGNGNLSYGATFTLTTDWTGSWTMALRHAGVTSGGTLKWSWAVYKLAGQ